ncbi:MAG: signal peptidase II [Bdellovibrionota bacterium]
MKKRDWLLVIAPLVFTWLIDRVTKIWASGLVGYQDFGLMGFTLHHNHGAMLGLFSDIPPVLRIVSLSTGGAFLTFTYFIIQYLLPIKSIPLRAGLSMLLGGILGNVTDRIIWGYVVDFLVFRFDKFTSPAMNLADVLQWVGYFLIVYALIKEGKILWPEENSRKNYWVNRRFQLRYCFSLTALGLALSLISGVFSYTYFRVSLQSLPYTTSRIQEQYLGPYILTFIIISLAFSALLFFVGLILSHRAAGPVYAFENFLEDLIAGKYRKLKLRQGDEFPHLEEVADNLSLALKKRLGDHDLEDELDEISKLKAEVSLPTEEEAHANDHLEADSELNSQKIQEPSDSKLEEE